MPVPPYLTRSFRWLRAGYPPGTPPQGYVPLIALVPSPPRSPAAFPIPVNSPPAQLHRPRKTAHRREELQEGPPAPVS